MPHPDLSPEQRAWFDAAAALIDIDRLYRLNREITAIHSPTGRERAASEYMTRYLAAIGLEATYQPMGEQSGNAIGRIRGSGGGPSLLLYAPIDTHLEGNADDLPWVGPHLRPDMIPEVREENGLVIGLGASNPKAMVTTLAEAVRVVRAAGVPLKGDLVVAYAGGGMPVDLAAPGNRGLSDGVSHLLTRGVHTDFALVMKPGNAVMHEEPGLCWFKVAVKGTLGYAGMPHNLPRFRSSIVPAAQGHPGARGMAAALYRAQQLGPGDAAGLDRRGALGLARPRRLPLGDDRDLSRHPLQSAHAAGRSEGAVRGGDRRHSCRAIPRSSSNGR